MGWLDNMEDGGQFDGLTNKGNNYNGAWGGPAQNGKKFGPKQKYEDWLATVPKEKSNTENYNLRRAFELAPIDQTDNFVKDPNAHLYSAYENPDTGNWEFMKKKDHPTLKNELEWFNSEDPEAVEFRNKYYLNDKGDTYEYTKRPLTFQNGGGMPGSVGFSYARIGAPSNGKYAKKTMASAKNGITKDDNGYWDPKNWGEPVEIGSNNITMQGVHQPLFGVSDKGDMKLMHPGKNYKFKGEKVTEYPVGKNGTKLKELDQLTNFTNYNTPQPGGWLDNI